MVDRVKRYLRNSYDRAERRVCYVVAGDGAKQCQAGPMTPALLILLAGLNPQAVPLTPDQLQDAAAADAVRAAYGAAAMAADDQASAEALGPMEAACSQAARVQRLLRDIADRETAARVLLVRQANSGGSEPAVEQAIELLADQNDLSLAHLNLEWTRNQTCSVAP